MKKFVKLYYRCSFNVCLWAFLSLIGLMFLSSSAFAQQSGDFYYSVSTGSITITGYRCPAGAAVIPDTIDYNGSPLPVVGIGKSAFAYCTGLTSVTIGNNVTIFGDLAFSDCTSLTSVTIPNNVTNFGVGAFAGCTGLTSVTIENGVKYIGPLMFEYCTGLTSVTIPDTVMSIADGAFTDCHRLTNAYFNGNAPLMGHSVFYACASNFTVCYTAGSTGFTSPFYGYPAAVCGETISSTTSVPSKTTTVQPMTTTMMPTTTASSSSTTTIPMETIKVDFVGSPTYGQVPLQVNFISFSTDNVSKYEWDFGDKGTSSEKDPSHLYSMEGTYTVSLRGSGNGQVDDEVKIGYITVKRTVPITTSTITPTTTTVPAGGGCPAIAVMGDGSHDIKTLRAFRNEMFTKTAEGKYYTALYYKNAFELSYIFANKQELKEKANNLVQKIMPTIVGFLIKREVVISEDTIQEAIQLIDALKIQASPILEKDLTRLKQDIQNGVIFSAFRVKVMK
jgi:hypothetical protein